MADARLFHAQRLSDTGAHAGGGVQRLFEQPPPLLPLVPGLGPEVEAVLLRALSKQPADRFESVREFARALKSAALSGFPSEVTPTPRPQFVPTTSAPASASPCMAV